MKVSPDGRDLIASFEGLSLEAYICPAGVLTIGYGHTRGVKIGDILPGKAAADMLLDEDLAQWGRDVERLIAGGSTSQHEFDAMVSLAYNIGIGGFQGSTVLRRHRAGDKAGAANAFRMWNKAKVGGVLRDVPGLTRRRAAEQALYLTPDHGMRPLAFAAMPAEEAEMPQAVEAPRSAFSSRTLIAAGVGGVSTLGAVADQVSSVSQVAGAAASTGYSVATMIRLFGPIVLGVIALAAIGYMGWRYLEKMRAGDVVSR